MNAGLGNDGMHFRGKARQEDGNSRVARPYVTDFVVILGRTKLTY